MEFTEKQRELERTHELKYDSTGFKRVPLNAERVPLNAVPLNAVPLNAIYDTSEKKGHNDTSN